MAKRTEAQKIEASRNARLWIRDVIFPAVGAVAAYLHFNPEAKEKAKNAFDDFKAKFKKEES